MTSDVFRIIAQHVYLEGRMFAWWRGQGWREIASPVFLAPR